MLLVNETLTKADNLEIKGVRTPLCDIFFYVRF